MNTIDLSREREPLELAASLRRQAAADYAPRLIREELETLADALEYQELLIDVLLDELEAAAQDVQVGIELPDVVVELGKDTEPEDGDDVVDD